MDQATLTAAFGPAFAGGFALQRLIEILDPLVNLLVGEEKKKVILGLLSLSIGLGLAYALDLHVLTHLGVSGPAWLKHLDYLVAGLFISGGTEGFNALLKYLNYKKEQTKANAVVEGLNARRAQNPSKIGLEDLMSNDFNSGDAMDIAYKSVTKTTGSTSPVEPTATLDKYNLRDDDIPSVRGKILNNPSYGLPRYARSMNPNALNGLGTDWTLQELADVIYDESSPA